MGRNNDGYQGSRDLVQPTPNRYASHSRVSLVDDDDTNTNNLLLDSSDEEAKWEQHLVNRGLSGPAVSAAQVQGITHGARKEQR